ncbi:MAG: hypothetical protein AB2A00_38800 [Myxococcota bacterium]
MATEIPDAAARCDLEAWGRDVMDMVKRGQEGESVVAPGGCSLFDGKLLVRGFPETAEKARMALVADEDCVPTLNTPHAQLRLTRVDGKAMVTLARSTGPGTDVPPSAIPEGKDWESALLRAARCPSPERRIKSDKDASVTLAYAVAMDALQASLEESVGQGTGPSEKARESLVRVCKGVKKFSPVKDPSAARAKGEKAVPSSGGNAEVEPLAATALIMAGSFTVFGEAATKFRVDDASLKAVRGMALGVVSNPPKTNLEGVCAMWAMANDMHGNLRRQAR